MDPTIDRSSLYRTLKLFVELGLVVSAETANGETIYEIPKPHRHHHLICRQCGTEQEIDEDVLAEALRECASAPGSRSRPIISCFTGAVLHAQKRCSAVTEISSQRIFCAGKVHLHA